MTIMQTIGGVATLIVVVALVSVVVAPQSSAASLIKNTGDAFANSIKAAKS